MVELKPATKKRIQQSFDENDLNREQREALLLIKDRTRSLAVLIHETLGEGLETNKALQQLRSATQWVRAGLEMQNAGLQ